MKTITEAISDLLYVRDIVVVPGLGAFVKKPIPAQVNRVANYFSAPSCIVEFDDNLREDNELITNYIKVENDIQDDEAKRLLAIFVSDCYNKLKNGEEVSLIGVGTLRYDWHSNIVLEQDTSLNFNGDAFGLCDFTATPIVHSATKDEIRAEIEQQQKEKNMPVTVDEDAIHNDDSYDYDYDDYYYARPIWHWILLALLLLACVAFGLQYFHIYNFKRLFVPKAPIVYTHDSVKEPVKNIAVDSIVLIDTIIRNDGDSLQIIVEQPLEDIEPIHQIESTEEVVPVPVENEILIVAGCFSNEENATKLEAKLKARGYQGACVEKHGTKWFVSYGHYHTDDEAKSALAKIKADGDAKAWIKK